MHPSSEPTTFPAGTLAAKLQAAIDAAAPIEPKKAGRRPTINAVRATGKGTSRLNPSQERAALALWIAARPDSTATVAEVESQFGKPCRGMLQKLIEKNHLVVVS